MLKLVYQKVHLTDENNNLPIRQIYDATGDCKGLARKNARRPVSPPQAARLRLPALRQWH
jgi:hypothetical protein